MYTRKQSTGAAILSLFIALTLIASPAFSQNYHYKVITPAQCSALDSLQSTHLQVAIRQASAGEMRFRISVLNPTDRPMSISLHHGHDLLFEDSSLKPTYDNVFNLTDLEDGDYVILISNGKEKITRNIRIQTETKIDRQLTVE